MKKQRSKKRDNTPYDETIYFQLSITSIVFLGLLFLVLSFSN